MDASPLATPPDASAPRRGTARFVVAVLAWSMTLVSAAADEPPPATGGTPPAFQPAEISIGEPIPLPFRAGAATGTTAAPADDPRATQPSGTAGDAAVPGSGWLGLAVAESTVPGRWRVEEVTEGGPAARAGILAGDELRSVNGTLLESAEQVSQALTTIAAGQDVRVAVARADRVSDIVLRAESRPATRQPPPAAFVPLPAAPVPLPEPAVAPPPAAAAAEWRSAPSRDEPVPAAGPPRTLGAAAEAGRTALGVRTVPIDPATQARFRLSEPTGAYVIGVVQELPAARAGVPPGSVIVALGDEPVRSPLELTRLVEKGPLDRPVPVQFVLPGGESKRANVVLQSLDAALERALVGEPVPGGAPPRPGPTPEPRRAERPAPDQGMIRAEIRAIRSRLEALERLLDAGGPR